MPLKLEKHINKQLSIKDIKNNRKLNEYFYKN